VGEARRAIRAGAKRPAGRQASPAAPDLQRHPRNKTTNKTKAPLVTRAEGAVGCM